MNTHPSAPRLLIVGIGGSGGIGKTLVVQAIADFYAKDKGLHINTKQSSHGQSKLKNKKGNTHEHIKQ